ncbi:MAG: hypothetical protein K2M37_07860 [Muribaculaceae bacterium]|nr:hypothetical protein [Muribaculaceae bacterium]
MKNNKILLAYFTRKGHESTSNCAILAATAENILKQKGVEFDTFAIEPVETYPEDQEQFLAVTKLEKENNARPAIVGKYSGMKDIGGILLIVPNWWDCVPQAVLTWLDDYDFSRTTIQPVISTTMPADNVERELRNFVQNDVLDAVEVKDVDTERAVAELEKAVESLLKAVE